MVTISPSIKTPEAKLSQRNSQCDTVLTRVLRGPQFSSETTSFENMFDPVEKRDTPLKPMPDIWKVLVTQTAFSTKGGSLPLNKINKSQYGNNAQEILIKALNLWGYSTRVESGKLNYQQIKKQEKAHVSACT